jgi:hypothetical protein
MRHVHLNVENLDMNKKFWLNIGGTPTNVGTIEGVMFGTVSVLLREAAPSGPAAGSVVSGIGFVVPNLQAALAKWKNHGIRTEPGESGQQAFIYTPDRMLKFEVRQDPSLSIPIAFQQVHFSINDNSSGGVAGVQAWYAKMFAAKPQKRGSLDTGEVPGATLAFSRSATPTAGTKGRALDHIGFDVKDLESFSKDLEASGIKLDVPYTERPQMGVSMVRLTDPWGTSIELNEDLSVK